MSEEISAISSDPEDIDYGIDEGHHHEDTVSGEGSPGGRHRPPFLNLNLMDRDSGVEIPQGKNNCRLLNIIDTKRVYI